MTDGRDGKRALVAGATGLVGGELIRQLSANSGYATVTALVRRPPRDLPSAVQAMVVDFGRLETAAGALAPDDVFCALGTTIRTAGSQEAFRLVDHDYVLEVARMARARGARHFLLVSSLGANPRSRVFYSRVKGEVEAALQELGYPSITIVRPSLLLGNRAELRLGETLMKQLGVLMPRKYRPVHASAVAACMLASAADPPFGVRIIESRDIGARASRQ
jgi:uncharacterized protein YbjT (DUF2867 family)